MEPAKRQRVNAPGAVAPSAQANDDEQRKHNGPCCGGIKLAGTGGGYKLVEPVHIGIAKRTKACWVSSDKKLVATKCGKCKKIIVPNAEQLDRMKRFNLKSVQEEAQLREIERLTGFSAAELAVPCEKD